MKRAPIAKCVMVLFFVLFLPGCRKQLDKSVSAFNSLSPIDNISQVSSDDLERHELHKELMLLDIPVPLYQHRLFFQDDTLKLPQGSLADKTLGYVSQLSVEDIVIFYLREMERLGWRLLKQFITLYETVLIFNAPTRVCVVIVNAHKDVASATHIIVHVGSIDAGLLWQADDVVADITLSQQDDLVYFKH